MQAIIDDEVTKRFSAEGLYQNWSGSAEARRNGRLTTQLNYWNKKKNYAMNLVDLYKGFKEDGCFVLWENLSGGFLLGFIQSCFILFPCWQ